MKLFPRNLQILRESTAKMSSSKTSALKVVDKCCIYAKKLFQEQEILMFITCFLFVCLSDSNGILNKFLKHQIPDFQICSSNAYQKEKY